MRRGNLIWGIIIILAGVLFMLDNLGLLRGVSAWQLIWPVTLILLGGWFLLGPRLWGRGRPLETRQVTLPLGAAQSAEIEINHGAGRLEINGQAASGTLLSGVFAGGVDVQSRDEARAWVKLSAPFDVIFPTAWVGGADSGFGWRVLLSPDVPMRLRLHTGASETEADLYNLRVSELDLETGASSSTITLPAMAGHTAVKIGSGAAKVSLRVPDGVAARIKVESGLSGIEINTARFPRTGDEYVSPDYELAANKVDIRVNTGVGSIDIR